MHDRLTQPNYIFTSYLALSAIILSNESDEVTLMGIYGNMINGKFTTIEVVCTFQMMNDLLGEIGSDADTVIDDIAKALNEQRTEIDVISLTNNTGLHILDHIFAFQAIYDEGPLGETEVPEHFTYLLNGFTKRNGIVPDFIDYIIPEDPSAYLQYLKGLLVMQYELYEKFRKTINQEYALIFSNLADPVYFTLAKSLHDKYKKRSS